MNFKKIIFSLGLVGCAWAGNAQDVHFTQFNLSPLSINPAFTGYHNGLYRVNAIYRNQWASVTSPYITQAFSVDAPIAKNIGQDDYLSGGLNLFTDKAGDGNLLNNTILGSIAYHKFFGQDANKSLSLGMQGGWAQKSIDLSRLYFGDEFTNGGYNLGTTNEQLKNKTSNFIANVGLNWGHKPGEKFSYQIGVAAYNINQPLETFQKLTPNSQVGLGMRINSQIGAIWDIGDRVSIRPAILYQTQTNASEFILGSEFSYLMGSTEVKSVASRLFLGGWTRTGDAFMVTGGLEFKGFRAGVAYDVTNSKLAGAVPGANSFEIGVSYVRPDPIDFARRVFFPCARF
jgi:type IX secretion system PorP/SprF family membrane protein